MATAEFAVAVPAVVLVLVLAASAVVAVLDQVRCVDAARAVARAVARGDAVPTARDLGSRLAPPGADLDVTVSGSEVVVHVRGDPPPALRWLGTRGAPSGRAVALTEVEP